jgi:carbamate kinase
MDTSSWETAPLVLVAMGGHAFIQKDQQGTIEDHEQNAAYIAQQLMYLFERDYRMVVTHGNGPQVGHLLLQNEVEGVEAPKMPLDVLVAMTEGSLGYILQQAFLNELHKLPRQRFVVTVVTQVIVDENDPAFDDPTKPIGPFLAEEVAAERRDRLNWKIREDAAGRGWRRMVPSPTPKRVLQRDMIRESALSGHIVIACGGGGIPVKLEAGGAYAGIEAVVDKDLTSSVLGSDIGAELLIILTSVPQVYINFGKPEQQALSAVTLKEVETLYAEGHFPPGSMGPKIKAVIDFLRRGGKRALVTDPASLWDAMEGRAGTHFIGKL